MLRRRLLRWLARPANPLTPRGQPGASEASGELSERADHSARRAFLAEHLFVHTHLPKTGGSAFSHAMAALFGGLHSLDTRLTRSQTVRALAPDDVTDLHFLSGHFVYGTEIPDRRTRLYLAVVREPVGRAVSGYRYMATTPEEPEHALVTGKSFEEAWHALDRDDAWQRRDLQSLMLLGSRDLARVDWDALKARVDDDYFLVIPQDRLAEAVRRLRNAFGVPWAPVARANVSKGAPVEVTEAMRRMILDANPSDARLYSYVAETFDKRLLGACRYIARRCLQRLDDDGAG